jgi:hypothetical protein
MRRFAVLAIAAIAMVTIACATRIVSSHVELGTDFTKYRTYDWGPADSLPTGDARLDNNEFFRDYFQGAIEKELATRRLALTSSDPDLLIHTHTNVSRRLQVETIVRESPWCQGGGCGPEVIESEMGTLMIDVVDAHTKKLIWRAWSRDDLSGVINDQQRLHRAVTDAVVEMMKLFPTHL